jgi:hypothetical protein
VCKHEFVLLFFLQYYPCSFLKKHGATIIILFAVIFTQTKIACSMMGIFKNTCI